MIQWPDSESAIRQANELAGPCNPSLERQYDGSYRVVVELEPNAEKIARFVDAGWTAEPGTRKKVPMMRVWRLVRPTRGREEFLEHVDKLLREWKDAATGDTSDKAVECNRIAHRLTTAFDSALGASSVYSIRLAEMLRLTMTAQKPTRAHREVGAFLDATLADMRGSWDHSHAADLKVAAYADLLDLADAYLTADAPDAWAAAVITGAVLERHLVALCRARALDVLNRNKTGISALSNALKGTGVFGRTQHKEIELWADIRNSAVHSSAVPLEPHRVPDMVRGVRLFIETYRV